MPDLCTTVGGLDLDHPLLLASGPLSCGAEAILRATRAGAAAAVTKTISCVPAVNPIPHIARFADGVLNAERWSDLDPSRWIDQELPRAKDGGATVIASVGLAPADVETLARPLELAGADALEVVSYDGRALPEMVSAAVSRVRVPVFAKLSANWGDPVAVARACRDVGASAITAIDSIGPALRIDVERRLPILGVASGWWSGSAIFPVALHVAADVARRVGLPVVGTGGVTDPDRVVEMLFAGAAAVGLCSLALTDGLEVFARLRDGLSERLSGLGIPSVRSAIGALQAEDASKPAATDGRTIRWNAERCTGCGACVRCCPYQARRAPTGALAGCRICGLCLTVCPVKALALERRAA